MNIIENVWHILKGCMKDRTPQPATKAQMWQILKEEWATIGGGLLWVTIQELCKVGQCPLACVMVQPPFFPFSSLSPFVCALPHLCHLPTPSDLICLPSTTSAPTPRCTHATVLHPHSD